MGQTEGEATMAYFYLAIAIVSEVVGTAALKATEEFTRLIPSLIVVVSYASAFFFLNLTLRTIPVGIAYAVWADAASSSSAWCRGCSTSRRSMRPPYWVSV